MNRLADKVALITGAASGLGRADAEAMVREGARVLLTDVNEAAGGQLAAELNAIRDGALSFDALVATATELEQRMRLAAERSTLPSDVDRELADALVVAIATDT